MPADRAPGDEAGQRGVSATGGQIEGGQQRCMCIEAAEGEYRFRGGEEFDVAVDQQLLLAAPCEEAPEAVQGGAGVLLLRRYRQREVLSRYRQPRDSARKAATIAGVP